MGNYMATHVLGPFTFLQAVFSAVPLYRRASNTHFPKYLFAEESILIGKNPKNTNPTGMDLSHQGINVELPDKKAVDN